MTNQADMATITYELLRPYVVLGKFNSKIQGRISELLLRLVQTDAPAEVKRLHRRDRMANR